MSKGFTNVTNSNSRTLTQRSIDVNVQSAISPFVRVDPFARAEQVKREYATTLDALLTEYERDIASALSDTDFSAAYRLAEIDGYLHRLGSVLRAHERQTSERAARAELAERGAAWVDAVSPNTN
jgi:hypothetical protein